MRTITLKIAAGASEEFAQAGNYVQVRQSAVDLTIENPLTAEKVEASQGDDFQLDDFKSLIVTNMGVTDQTIKLTVSKNKKAGSAKVGGSVSVVGVIDANVTAMPKPVRVAGGYLSTTQKTVTPVSQQFDGINNNRNFYCIQNKSLTGKIWINPAGVAATAANGILLLPGEMWEPAFVPLGAINVIGDIASNPDVLVVQLP